MVKNYKTFCLYIPKDLVPDWLEFKEKNKGNTSRELLVRAFENDRIRG